MSLGRGTGREGAPVDVEIDEVELDEDAEPIEAAARNRVAVETFARNEAALRRTAQRYSICADDADEALQRALEILLNKAPSEDPRDLIRWTQTVIKHEALAVRAERERTLAGPAAATPVPGREDWVAMLPAEAAGPAERAERHEAIERSREALATLKPQELRALGLLAEGYSYREIADITGYSPRKVNRAIAEGRGALPPLPRPPRGRRPVQRAGAAPLRLRRRRGGAGRRRHPARAPPHLPPLPLDPARLPRRARRRGGAAAGPAAGPRHRRRSPARRLRGGRDPGRRRVGRLRLDPRRARRRGRHARSRDDGARQGAGALRRDGRRGGGLRRDRGRPGAAARPAHAPRAPPAKVAHHERHRAEDLTASGRTTKCRRRPRRKPKSNRNRSRRKRSLRRPTKKARRNRATRGPKRNGRRSKKRSPRPRRAKPAPPNTPKRLLRRRSGTTYSAPVGLERRVLGLLVERQRRRGVRAVSARADRRLAR